MIQIEEERIDKVIHNNSLEYANYIIKNRAIPDIRDGMKPVYRRILYTMHVMKAHSLTKSQNVTGQVMQYHAHGDSYGTLVGMAQNDNNLTPLITGKGNFAQHTSRDMQAAAARYTECKLSEISIDMMKDLNKNVVDFIPNFDDTKMMPEVLPVKFPAILHYAQEGIALGMASKTPSFNMNDIRDAIKLYLQTGEETILIPDFATGAYIIKEENILNSINYHGKGSIKMRGKAEIIGNTISITEIPYSTTREAIIDKIVELVKSKKIEEITDVKDLTGLNGMEIEVTCKRNSNMELVLQMLYLNTPLESSYSCNMNVIVDGLPKVLGVWSIIDYWLSWRRYCIKRALTNDITKMKKELNILRGLEKVLLDIDNTIDIIRKSSKDMINTNLITFFKINQEQAEYISNMKLRNINEDYIIDQLKAIKNLEDDIKLKEETLESEDLINNIICNDLDEIVNKYGRPRRSQVITVKAEEKIKVEKVIKQVKEYPVKVIITEQGYIKKLNPSATLEEQKIKEGDSIIHEFETNNINEIIVFVGTDAYKIKIDLLTDCKSNSMGDYIPSMLGIYNANEIIGYSIIDDKYKFLLIGYDNGKLAKIDLNSFKTETNRKKLANSLFKDAEVFKMETVKDECELILINIHGKEIPKQTSQLQLKKSRASQGSTLIRNMIDFYIK